MNFFQAPVLAACTVVTLTGCSSGGGTSGGDTYVPNSALFAASSPDATLTVLGLNRATDGLYITTSSLTAPSTLSGGGLTGTVSYSYTAGANNVINLSSGKTAAIEDNGTRFAFGFGNADMAGIAGVATASMPTSGTATYNGFADALVNDGSGTLTVLDSSTVSANFGSNSVTARLSNSDGRWIQLTGATISGSSFSGGNLTASSVFSTSPGSTTTLQHQGQFFGSGASEAGGVFLLDRTGANITFKAQGVYGGNDGS